MLSVRKSKNNPADFEKSIAEFCDYAYETHGLFTVFLPMQKRVDCWWALRKSKPGKMDFNENQGG